MTNTTTPELPNWLKPTCDTHINQLVAMALEAGHAGAMAPATAKEIRSKVIIKAHQVAASIQAIGAGGVSAQPIKNFSVEVKEAVPAHQDDILIWPDGVHAYRHEFSEMRHKSDDYELVRFGTATYDAIENSYETCARINTAESRIERVYRERNALAVAFVRLAASCGWNAGITWDKSEGADRCAVAMVDLPTGLQLSWHLSDDSRDALVTNQLHYAEYKGEWDGTFVARDNDGSDWVNTIPFTPVRRDMSGLPRILPRTNNPRIDALVDAVCDLAREGVPVRQQKLNEVARQAQLIANAFERCRAEGEMLKDMPHGILLNTFVVALQRLRSVKDIESARDIMRRSGFRKVADVWAIEDEDAREIAEYKMLALAAHATYEALSKQTLVVGVDRLSEIEARATDAYANRNICKKTLALTLTNRVTPKSEEFWQETADNFGFVRLDDGCDDERHFAVTRSGLREFMYSIGYHHGMPAVEEITQRIGGWLSAALNDPKTCKEMRDDIEAWFNVGMPRVNRHYLQEIRDALGDQTIDNIAQVAAGIRDFKSSVVNSTPDALLGLSLYGKSIPDQLDPVVQANVDLLVSRSAVGLKKYGVNLEDSDLTPTQVLRHLLEELLDAANYTQTLLRKSGKTEDDFDEGGTL